MNGKDFQAIESFCRQFNTYKQSVEPMQLIRFLQDTKNQLYTFGRELKITAFSLHGRSQENNNAADISDKTFTDTITALNGMNVCDDYCSQNNVAVIEQLKDQCISALNGLRQTWGYMQSKTSVRRTFYNHHEDYSFHSEISDNQFLEVYQMYLNNGCYDSNKQTFNCLRYFITGNQRPLLLESVLWKGELYLLKSFLSDMGCDSALRTDWAEIAQRIFTVKNQSNETIFIKAEDLLQSSVV